MNFRHLEIMCMVAKCHSIKEAAGKLNVSQPYLSTMIKSLEKELGYTLINRNSQGIEFSDEGKAFLVSSKKILTELDHIYHLNQTSCKDINLASYYSPLIMRVFLQFTQQGKRYNDRIREMGNEEVFQSLNQQNDHLGIVFLLGKSEERIQKYAAKYQCEYQILKEHMPVYVLMSKQHEAAHKTSMKLSDIKKYPFVCYDDTSTNKLMELLRLHQHPDMLKVSDRGSFHDALQSGKYLSITAGNLIIKDDDMCYLPLKEEDVWISGYWLKRKGYVLQEREEALIRYMKMHI